MAEGQAATHSLVPSIYCADGSQDKQFVVPAEVQSPQSGSQATQEEESKKKPELHEHTPLFKEAF